ncbi:multinuclear nonheme iron-dependent oxidase [Chitinimonas sp. BJB300]|uniref:multinuclear nonheme iron-dependent oxidase n=2 Tax=Chitinimonas sp. BJB300 TaxID=1559339 RepID=UPI000C0F4EB2|nr:DUF692 family multinuclear iron-containing protein [Chitinimonas sp. BJB300]PHV12400.1 hypothetical protein CSQ89_05790 [Chitinimonas sp. BJB300]
MKSYIIGAGWCPAFAHFRSGLAMPDSVQFMELGFRELFLWCDAPYQRHGLDLSLHLARSPITEDKTNQQHFIRHVRRKLEAVGDKSRAVAASMRSIGVHLTGSRSEGIGPFGFSSHYQFDNFAERRATYFLENISSETGLPVWIENANFYSHSAKEIIQTWQSVTRLCDHTGAGLIVDLSHIYIEASNAGISPVLVLGMVPWHHAREIHISGVILGANGVRHDGHSQPVSPDVWALLDICLESDLLQGQVIINIEHTDPAWMNQVAEYYADFNQLQLKVAASATQSRVSPDLDPGAYAKGFLRKILMRQMTYRLKPGHTLEQVALHFEPWLEDAMLKRGLRLTFTQEESFPEEQDKICLALEDFNQYIEQVI